MPKILLLNANPCGNNSNSGIFLSYFKIFVEDANFKCHNEILNSNNHEEIIEKIFNVDKVVIAFTTYAGSVPSTLLELFYDLEAYKESHIGLFPNVYAIIDSDFFDKRDNDISTRILKRACKSIGFDYGFTLKIASSSLVINSPFKLQVIKLIEKMELMVYLGLCNTNLFTKIPIPNWLLIKLLNRYWLKLGIQNGLKKKDMYTFPLT